MAGLAIISKKKKARLDAQRIEPGSCPGSKLIRNEDTVGVESGSRLWDINLVAESMKVSCGRVLWETALYII